MTKKAPDLASCQVGEELVRQQLDRILAGPTFQQVDRLRRFLSFVVLESLAGRRDELKEYVVGIQVFDKEPSFDPRADPVVRVQARRLRARLVRYYTEEGQSDEILIDLPKGGYSPVFSRRETSAVRRSVSVAIVGRNSACVQGFADHSAAGDLEYFCKGVREEIIHHLTSLRNLRVLAWDGTNASASEPGNHTHPIDAAVIISGGIRTAGDTVRVTAQFLDGSTGCYLWSTSIDGSIADTLGTQERVATAVAAKLGSELIELTTAVRKPGTVNLAAHNLYLQGRYHLSQRTEEGMRKAAEFFEKALVEDAQYGLAHSGLSDAYALLGHYGVVRPTDVFTKVAASAASAVILDGNSAEAHSSLAHARSTQDWDWQGAEREFLRAIGLDPRAATPHHWYATTSLVPMGRLSDALEQLLVAQSLDPISAIIARDVALSYYYMKDSKAALDQCDNAIELNPHFFPAYLTLASIQEQRGDLDEAASALERAVSLGPNPRALRERARIYAVMDQRRQVFKMLHTLETLAADRYVSPFDLAVVHFALDQIDESHAWLSKAYNDRCFELISIKADPGFKAFRTHPRLAPIISQIGLADPVIDEMALPRYRSR